MTLFSLILGILICFGIPIGGVLLLRKRAAGIWASFLLGIAAFTVSQVCIRIPILSYVLPNFAWFSVLQLNPLLYGLFLAVTAALFEEGARWIAMRFLKRREVLNGMAFGLGHGGVEAVLLVGSSYVVTLCLYLTGWRAQLSIYAGTMLIGGLERFFAIMFHVGASLVVMNGLRIGRSGRYLLLALLLHTLMDMGPAAGHAFELGTVEIEAYAAVIAIVTLAVGLSCYARKEKGVCAENNESLQGKENTR